MCGFVSLTALKVKLAAFGGNLKINLHFPQAAKVDTARNDAKVGLLIFFCYPCRTAQWTLLLTCFYDLFKASITLEAIPHIFSN